MARYWDIAMLAISMFFLNRCTKRLRESIEISIDKNRLENPR